MIKKLIIPKNTFGVNTPLRYPGGKSSLTTFISEIIAENQNTDTYVEPYSGGVGIGISLLIREKIKRLIINDKDRAVFAFWKVLKESPEYLIDRVRKVKVSLSEREFQKKIYLSKDISTSLKIKKLAFAFLFLNRTNISGILTAGPIGGKSQTKYKIDARFNKELIITKLENISRYAQNIEVYNKEGEYILKKFDTEDSMLLIDPPYVKQGKNLYLNSLDKDDHKRLSTRILGLQKSKWILTYDFDPIIYQDCYSDSNIFRYELNYSAYSKRKEEELLICSDNLLMNMNKYTV